MLHTLQSWIVNILVYVVKDGVRREGKRREGKGVNEYT